MTLPSPLPSETPLERVKRLFREAQELDHMARLKLEEAEAASAQLPTPIEEYIARGPLEDQDEWLRGK
jgi:hypothetical protein